MDRVQEEEVTKNMYAAWDELVPRIIELAQNENNIATRMLMSDIEDSTNKGNRVNYLYNKKFNVN